MTVSIVHGAFRLECDEPHPSDDLALIRVYVNDRHVAGIEVYLTGKEFEDEDNTPRVIITGGDDDLEWEVDRVTPYMETYVPNTENDSAGTQAERYNRELYLRQIDQDDAPIREDQPDYQYDRLHAEDLDFEASVDREWEDE